MTDKLFNLTGKTCLVTGASRGIGAATAHQLARFGAHVIVSSRKLESCEGVVEAIRAQGGVASAIAAHVGEIESLDRLFGKIQDRGFGLDVLVNNAAANPYFGPMVDMGLGAFQKTVDVNLRGYFYSTVQAAKIMRERGQGGAIVNVASVNARRAAALQGVYSMTKAGIVSLTESFAKELAEYGIRVNAVLPGLTETKFAAALTQNPKILGMMLKQIPLGRVADPDEIAPTIAYLCTPAASYITGASFTVDGGYLA